MCLCEEGEETSGGLCLGTYGAGGGHGIHCREDLEDVEEGEVEDE